MHTRIHKPAIWLIILSWWLFSVPVNGQANTFGRSSVGLDIFFIIFLLIILAVVLSMAVKTKQMLREKRKTGSNDDKERFSKYLQNLDSDQIGICLTAKKCGDEMNDNKVSPGASKLLCVTIVLVSILSGPVLYAQTVNGKSTSLIGETGIVITLILILLPILGGIVLMFFKVRNLANQRRNKQNLEEADQLATYLSKEIDQETMTALEKRKKALDYQLSHTELSGDIPAFDEKGIIINAGTGSGLTFVAIKKKALKRPNIDPKLSRLVLWYLATATFWLLFGTTIGEYVGIKFVAPDADHISWLSFGRLRPVHTNSVFWGWASLAMLGLGYYIVPMVSNTSLASLKKGWYALLLINASVFLGTICLMAGINNGGGEFREYIWPVMLLFAIGLILTLINFLQTIARRTTKEIYISNWYMVAAVIFAIVITIVAYIPFWQNGLGETIVQGYYMHQGVGMWF
ncbi:MAG: cbb3-type cytochrome c oxidase subunit I, partial [Ferruginibacter sp.]